MGCDIHCYIEYYDIKSFNNRSNSYWVNSFNSGELNFGRDYTLFGLIAGVRSVVDPIFSVKGIPVDPELGYSAKYQYYVKVLPDSEYKKCVESNSQYQQFGFKQLIAESKFNEFNLKPLTNIDNEGVIMPNPNYHSATWLELNELKIIRKEYLLEVIKYWSDISRKQKLKLCKFIESKSEFDLMNYTFPDFDSASLYATICSMEGLEKCNINYKSRFVCWFDS